MNHAGIIATNAHVIVIYILDDILIGVGLLFIICMMSMGMPLME